MTADTTTAPTVTPENLGDLAPGHTVIISPAHVRNSLDYYAAEVVKVTPQRITVRKPDGKALQFNARTGREWGERGVVYITEIAEVYDRPARRSHLMTAQELAERQEKDRRDEAIRSRSRELTERTAAVLKYAQHHATPELLDALEAAVAALEANSKAVAEAAQAHYPAI